MISDAPIIVLVLLVLSNLPAGFIRLMHFAGAAFIFYLAAIAIRNLIRFDPERDLDNQPNDKTVLKAAVVNLLNPGPYLGWSLVMGPLFLKGYREAPINGIALVVGFYSTMILSLAGMIFLFSFARNLGPRVNRAALVVSIAGLVCFGIYQLWLGINANQ